jgi:hypothetical protein
MRETRRSLREVMASPCHLRQPASSRSRTVCTCACALTWARPPRMVQDTCCQNRRSDGAQGHAGAMAAATTADCGRRRGRHVGHWPAAPRLACVAQAQGHGVPQAQRHCIPARVQLAVRAAGCSQELASETQAHPQAPGRASPARLHGPAGTANTGGCRANQARGPTPGRTKTGVQRGPGQR